MIVLFISIGVSWHELFKLLQLWKETKLIQCNSVDAIVNMTYSEFYQQNWINGRAENLYKSPLNRGQVIDCAKQSHLVFLYTPKLIVILFKAKLKTH